MQSICELPIHHCSRKSAPIARPVLASLLLAAISSPPQTLSAVKEASLYNRPVLLVGNDKLEVCRSGPRTPYYVDVNNMLPFSSQRDLLGAICQLTVGWRTAILKEGGSMLRIQIQGDPV